jgi:hypothetical protein
LQSERKSGGREKGFLLKARDDSGSAVMTPDRRPKQEKGNEVAKPDTNPTLAIALLFG